MKKLILIYAILTGILMPIALSAEEDSQERIQNYAVEMQVNTNRSLTIDEHIRVFANQEEIRHGIYRDIPVVQKINSFLKKTYSLRILSIKRDGHNEPWHIKDSRIYIGDRNKILTPGFYDYELKYRMSDALGFVSNQTTLYWNVIGDGWSFPIKSASLRLTLPEGAGDTLFSVKNWSGPRGSTEGQAPWVRNKDILNFTLKEGLKTHEAWTVRVSWKNGFVTVPTQREQWQKLWRDNRGLFILIVGIPILFLYFFITWLRVGKDPTKESIVVQYAPPQNFSPAAMRYISKMGYDDKIFSITVINMAVKGLLKIEEKKGKYVLHKTADEMSKLSKEEKAVFSELFSGRKSIAVDNENHSAFSDAIHALKKSMKNQFEAIYFVTNIGIFIVGLILSILILFAAVFVDGSGFVTGFMLVWILFWNIGIYFLLKQTVLSWKTAIHSRQFKGIKIFGSLFLSAFALPFIGGDVLAIYMLFSKTVSGLPFLLATLLILILNLIFYHLLKAPTRAGRRVMDLIEGFKMYINAAEKKRIEFFNPPDKNVETFEKFLPYAFAFDSEKNWAAYFNNVVSAALQSGNYSPSWYLGNAISLGYLDSFTSELGSGFSSALSSAAVSTSSSGGGFSGGGGGGGGGGGW